VYASQLHQIAFELWLESDFFWNSSLGVGEMEGIRNTNAFDVPLVNTPGRLGIVNGRVRMIKPKGFGPWPVIIPGENVEIFYGNQRIAGPTVIDDVQDLRVMAESIPSESRFEITVSPDKMAVTLSVTFRPGKQYQLVDAQYTRKLTVQAKLVKEIPPEPIDPMEVLKYLREHNLSGQVDYKEIMQACSELKDGEYVIARGIAPRPPIDGRVQLVCDFMTRPISRDDRERIDFRERMLIASVEPGDVLARWYPPKLGTPGRNVYGEEVMPRRPKMGIFKAGRGVKLIENGRIAVAEIAGRPVYRKGVLSVNQQIIVQQDVNMATGNIKFTGDVVVLGDVTEAMTVESGEIVDVKGNVYHAQVRAGSHIRVGAKLIGGHLMAGLMHPGLNEAASVLGRLGKDVLKAAAAVSQVTESKKGQYLAQDNVGLLIKRLFEQRFPHVPSLFAGITEFLKSLHADKELMQDNEDLKTQLSKALALGQYFIGAGPLYLESGAQLEQAAACLLELKDRFEALVDSSAEIIAGYCQNAQLEASGDITIRGPLTYNCHVSAGSNLVMYGECRSGEYYARSSIRAQTVGTGSMGVTRLAVGEGGTIRAAVLNPGVQLKIGAIPYEVTTTMYNAEFRINDGTIVARTFH
jgi:hypothetical protein